MANLSIEVAGNRFPNPIMPAAGPPVRDGRAMDAGGLCVTRCRRAAIDRVPASAVPVV